MLDADPYRSEELARNVAIALRFKKSQGTPAMPQVEKEVLAAHYDRARGGNFHLANNGRDQGWAHPGMYLRDAFPDRVDVMERVIADGDRVGLLFRVTGTHTGHFFGIAPTGRKIDVYEIDCELIQKSFKGIVFFGSYQEISSYTLSSLK